MFRIEVENIMSQPVLFLPIFCLWTKECFAHAFQGYINS